MRVKLTYSRAYSDLTDIEATVDQLFPSGDLNVTDDNGHRWTVLRYEVEHGLVEVTA